MPEPLFLQIVLAFPELGFYMIDGSSISSGGKPADECAHFASLLTLAPRPRLSHSPSHYVSYSVVAQRCPARTPRLAPNSADKRTMGAAFAVYWLMRIGIDGERGFCFGVDEHWVPNVPPAGAASPGVNFFALSAEERRLSFYLRVRQLVFDA